MKTQDHKKMLERQQRFFAKNLSRLESGELDVDRFLEGAENLERQLVLDARIHTSDFDAWAAYYRQHYPEVAEDSIRHEQAHARVAQRYGVSVMYGLVLVTDSEVHDFGNIAIGTMSPSYLQAFLTDNSREVARRDRWNASKLLRYINELAGAPDSLSDGDRSMIRD